MSKKFKVGDRVKTTDNYNASSKWRSREAVIYAIDNNKSYPIKLRFDDGDTCSWSDDGDLIEINKKNMSLKESFALAFKSEPNKSFRKAGITNGDDLLTDDGTEIFLGWLLKKYGDNFKTEVVDMILAEEKE